jgi:anaerobic selenocysteine-containing dehydrogenase
MTFKQAVLAEDCVRQIEAVELLLGERDAPASPPGTPCPGCPSRCGMAVNRLLMPRAGYFAALHVDPLIRHLPEEASFLFRAELLGDLRPEIDNAIADGVMGAGRNRLLT